MGLTWDPIRHAHRWIGYDAGGDDAYALVERQAGGWALHLTKLGCPIAGGTWIPRLWPTDEAAMEAADRYVVAHVDDVGLGVPAPYARLRK